MPLTCQNCGGRVDLPAGFSRAKARCPGCGYYVDVPADARAVAATDDDYEVVTGDDFIADPPPAPPPQAIARAVARPVSPSRFVPLSYDPTDDLAFTEGYLEKWDRFAQGENDLTPILNDNKDDFEAALTRLLQANDDRAPARLVFYAVVQVGGSIPVDSDLGKAAISLLGAAFPISENRSIFSGDLYFWWVDNSRNYRDFLPFSDWLRRDFAQTVAIPMFRSTCAPPTGRAAVVARPAPPPPPPPPAEYHPATDDDMYGFAEKPAAPLRNAPVVAKKKAPKAKVRPQANPIDHRPKFEPDGPGGAPLLRGTQDEDDDKPYEVPGTGLQKCRDCRGELPMDATFCVHCGREMATGAVAGRTYQPMAGDWEEGWPLQTRLYIFAGLQVFNVLSAILVMVAEGVSPRDLGTVATHMFFQLIHMGMQAFLLGTYDSISLRRTIKGVTTLTQTRRFAFYKMEPTKINWKDSAGIGVVGSQDPGLFTWMIAAYLALFCLLPGVVFYWMVIRPARYQINITSVYNTTDEVAFHSKDQDEIVAIAHMISEATGLTYRKVL